MTTLLPRKQSWRGRHLKIVSLAPIQQRERIHDAIAQRAFQICKHRNCAPGHQEDDWRRAQSEVVRPLDCGFIMLDDKIGLSTDATSFAEGEIEICAEPTRLTICGNECTSRTSPSRDDGGSPLNPNLIFRSVELPVQIQPSQITATFRGRMIEIDLPRAVIMRQCATEKHAA